jgi:hypothetical protein
VIEALGNRTPGFELRIRESFQLVIVPWKMPASVVPVRLMPRETPSMLVGTVIAPISVGK